MTMLFTDSFDHYTINEMQRKWELVESTSTTSIQASGGRRGGGCWRASSSSGVRKNLGAGAATMIVGFAFKVDALSDAATDFVQFLESGVVHMALRVNSNGSFDVYRGTSLLATSAAGVLSAGAWQYLEFKATIHDTAGSYYVHVDGVAVLSNIGSPSTLDTRNVGTSGLVNQVFIGGVTARIYEFDDLVILDTAGSRNNNFLGDIRVDCYRPNGNGNSSQFVGSDSNSTDNYLLVDDTTPDDDATYVESGTVGDKDLYAFPAMSHTPASIFAVQALACLKKDDAGSRSACLQTRSGGTDYSGSNVALSDSFMYLRELRETDPGGASPDFWHKATFEAAEFGIKVVA